MATGITQDQVNGAIDRLVAAGERPTIERIRAVLGTGSPNTVNRMLDAWWAGLSTRLAEQQTKVLLPEAPAEVAVAATQVWKIAIEQARARSESEIATERGDLARAQSAMNAERAALQKQFEQQAAAVEAANQARGLAESRVQDLQRLVDQQAALLADLQLRHDQAVAAQATLTAKLDAAQVALAAAQEKATNERITLEATHRAAEDRWLREVDRARQDEADVATQLRQLEKTSGVLAHKATQQINELSERLHRAGHAAAAKTARLAALEGQLDRLHAQLKERLGRPIARAKPAAAKKIGKSRRIPA